QPDSTTAHKTGTHQGRRDGPRRGEVGTPPRRRSHVAFTRIPPSGRWWPPNAAPGSSGVERADLQVAEPDGIIVVLQHDMPALLHPEAGKLIELARFVQ